MMSTALPRTSIHQALPRELGNLISALLRRHVAYISNGLRGKWGTRFTDIERTGEDKA